MGPATARGGVQLGVDLKLPVTSPILCFAEQRGLGLASATSPSRAEIWQLIELFQHLVALLHNRNLKSFEV